MNKALSGSVGLDYVIAPSVCVMVNVIDYADEQVSLRYIYVLLMFIQRL